MRSVLFALAALAVLPLQSRGQSLPSTRCGVGIPQAESDGYIPLPHGDVFCPLTADPKAIRSFASFLRARATQVNPSTARAFDTDVGAVGIGDRIGLGRWNGARPNDGVQLSLEAGVFAQFDVNASSFDLLNADYVIGLPLTFRRGALSGRLRVYHQSSHLGDEFLLRPDDPEQERENLSFEASELILSVDWGALRLYGGGEYLVNRSPASLAKVVGHGGVEIRPNLALFSVGPLATVRPIAMADVQRLVAGAVPGLTADQVSVVMTALPAPTKASDRELARFGPITVTRASMTPLRALVAGVAVLNILLLGLLLALWTRMRRAQGALAEARAMAEAPGQSPR
jgi:hypothetical protein